MDTSQWCFILLSIVIVYYFPVLLILLLFTHTMLFVCVLTKGLEPSVLPDCFKARVNTVNELRVLAAHHRKSLSTTLVG